MSDVHANWPALQALEKDAGYADFVIHAGDSVGYYPFPNECVSWLREHADVNVMGNHDYAVVNNDLRGFSRESQLVLSWTNEHLSALNLKYLSELPDVWTGSVGGLKIGVVHGGLGNHHNEFLHANADESVLNSYLHKLKVDLLVTGHVHQLFVRQLSSGLHINPGSVGQPRDYNPNPSYVILEVKGGRVETVIPRRFGYDASPVEEKMKSEMLPLTFVERLKKGY